MHLAMEMKEITTLERSIIQNHWGLNRFVGANPHAYLIISILRDKVTYDPSHRGFPYLFGGMISLQEGYNKHRQEVHLIKGRETHHTQRKTTQTAQNQDIEST